MVVVAGLRGIVVVCWPNGPLSGHIYSGMFDELHLPDHQKPAMGQRKSDLAVRSYSAKCEHLCVCPQ